jgi:hypothetical protein
VSYDIYFLKRQPGQSWDDALEQREEASDDSTLTPELLAAWDRIVSRARDLLGEIELFENEDGRELSQESTGIQASLFGDEVTIAVPYWHTGDQATKVLGSVYALAEVIEHETGLDAYDPQVDRPLAETPSTDAGAIMSTVADDLHRRYL